MTLRPSRIRSFAAPAAALISCSGLTSPALGPDWHWTGAANAGTQVTVDGGAFDIGVAAPSCIVPAGHARECA